MNTTTVETLGAVAERQTFITNPMQAMLDEFGPAALVEVTSRHTAFGTFLVSIVPVEEAHDCVANRDECGFCGECGAMVVAS